MESYQLRIEAELREQGESIIRESNPGFGRIYLSAVELQAAKRSSNVHGSDVSKHAPATNLSSVPSHRVKSSLGHKAAARLPVLLGVLVDLFE